MTVIYLAKPKSVPHARALQFYIRSLEDFRPISNCEFGQDGIAEQLVYIVPIDGIRAISIDEVRIGLESARKAA